MQMTKEQKQMVDEALRLEEELGRSKNQKSIYNVSVSRANEVRLSRPLTCGNENQI